MNNTSQGEGTLLVVGDCFTAVAKCTNTNDGSRLATGRVRNTNKGEKYNAKAIPAPLNVTKT